MSKLKHLIISFASHSFYLNSPWTTGRPLLPGPGLAGQDCVPQPDGLFGAKGLPKIPC